VRGICPGDTAEKFVIYTAGNTVTPPRGASDAFLMPWHVERSKIMVRARFAPVPGRHILQYMAVVERPRLLCLRGLDTELRYDVNQRTPPTDPDFNALIWWWESLQLGSPRSGG